jgi:hypothetical protein
MEQYRNDPQYRAEIREQQRLKYAANAWKMKMAINAKRYGISTEEYAERVTRACGICGEFKEPMAAKNRLSMGRMHVDHCHTTGKLRGTLCDQCNMGLGNLGDSLPRLESAITYLRLWL